MPKEVKKDGGPFSVGGRQGCQLFGLEAIDWRMVDGRVMYGSVEQLLNGRVNELSANARDSLLGLNEAQLTNHLLTEMQYSKPPHPAGFRMVIYLWESGRTELETSHDLFSYVSSIEHGELDLDTVLNPRGRESDIVRLMSYCFDSTRLEGEIVERIPTDDTRRDSLVPQELLPLARTVHAYRQMVQEGRVQYDDPEYWQAQLTSFTPFLDHPLVPLELKVALSDAVILQHLNDGNEPHQLNGTFYLYGLLGEADDFCSNQLIDGPDHQEAIYAFTESLPTNADPDLWGKLGYILEEKWDDRIFPILARKLLSSNPDYPAWWQTTAEIAGALASSIETSHRPWQSRMETNQNPPLPFTQETMPQLAVHAAKLASRVKHEQAEVSCSPFLRLLDAVYVMNPNIIDNPAFNQYLGYLVSFPRTDEEQVAFYRILNAYQNKLAKELSLSSEKPTGTPSS